MCLFFGPPRLLKYEDKGLLGHAQGQCSARRRPVSMFAFFLGLLTGTDGAQTPPRWTTVRDCSLSCFTKHFVVKGAHSAVYRINGFTHIPDTGSILKF